MNSCSFEVRHRPTITRPPSDPFAAVKCNPDLAIASTLAECGVNFDCASATEMDMIVSKVGVSPDRVIYAHPTKAPSQLRYAVDNGVDLTVVDSIEEVEKLAALHPTAKIVVRIKVDDTNSAMPFSAKFGADLSAVPAIMDRASKLGMAVVGVSYHVGSGCEHPDTFYKAVGAANTAFGYGKAAGHAMTLLNLGGGYPGRADPGAPTHMLPSIFPTVAARINAALNEFFPESRVDSVSGQPIRVIAEPGRYFVSSCQTMATPIIAQRIEGDPAGDGMSRLYISDGVYGSFNCVIFDQQKPSPSFVPRELLEAPDAAAVLEAMTPLAPPSDDDEVPSQHMSVWGPTCDSVDLVVKDLRVPLGTRIGTGDWFVWDNMGAYTNASASTFNGFHVPNRAYIPASAQWDFEGLVQEVAQELHQHQPTPFS